MSKHDLTAEQLRERFSYDPDTGVFTQRLRTTSRVKVGEPLGSLTHNGYVEVWVHGSKYMAHRLAWLYVYGKWPEAHLDHINRVRTDNRIGNLREASKVQNGQNTKLNRRNTSGVKGVCWCSQYQKWKAYICLNRSVRALGRFTDINDAIAARKAAEALLHPFATT